jgi:hypothetical protein
MTHHLAPLAWCIAIVYGIHVADARATLVSYGDIGATPNGTHFSSVVEIHGNVRTFGRPALTGTGLNFPAQRFAVDSSEGLPDAGFGSLSMLFSNIEGIGTITVSGNGTHTLEIGAAISISYLLDVFIKKIDGLPVEGDGYYAHAYTYVNLTTPSASETSLPWGLSATVDLGPAAPPGQRVTEVHVIFESYVGLPTFNAPIATASASSIHLDVDTVPEPASVTLIAAVALAAWPPLRRR